MKYWIIYLTHRELSGPVETQYNIKPISRLSLTGLLSDLPPLIEHGDAVFPLIGFRVEEHIE